MYKQCDGARVRVQVGENDAHVMYKQCDGAGMGVQVGENDGILCKYPSKNNVEGAR